MSDIISRLNAGLNGRYAVEREVGRGGMATVFLAKDVRHGRSVAIKVLHPTLAATVGPERFLREIEIAARLTHPNILGLLDSGDADGLLFYVMPYIEGESLSERIDREGQLGMDDALRITSEVADALTYAHERDVVHRDIKPENILLSGGHAVVADFGIAKAVTAAGADKLTETGMVVGTPAYMSPEQSTGAERLDGRSDLYALACVFYHMVVGQPPFTGPSAQAILARHAVDPVAPVSTVRSTVPSGVDHVLARALAKVPADRYATARQFADELESASRASPGHAAPPRSLPRWAMALGGVSAVAVIAFGLTRVGGAERNIDRLSVLAPTAIGAEAEEHILLGVYNALRSELGQAGVTVVGGYQTMRQFRDDGSTIPEIAAAMRVDAVIEPSVFWAGDSVGVDVALLDGRTEEALWSQSYEADARDVMQLFRLVTRAIAHEIQLAIEPRVEARLAEVRPVDPEVQEAYYQGRFYSSNLTLTDLQASIDYFNLALAKDSTFAPAYAGLSWTWIAMRQLGYLLPAEATPLAIRAARRALALDSLLPEGHHALATAEGWGGWDWELAEAGLRRALALNPGLGDARADYSHLLLVLRRFDEAEAQIDSALASDPLNIKFRGFRGVIYNAMGRDEDAAAAFTEILRIIPNMAVARSVLTDVAHIHGRYDEAVDHIVGMYAAQGMPEFATAIRQDYSERGYRETMLAAAERLEAMAATAFVPPMRIARAYAYGGDGAKVLDWLEAGLAEAEPNLPYIGVTPLFAFLKNEPRFRTLLRRMRLPWATAND